MIEKNSETDLTFASDPLQFELRYLGRFVGAGIDDRTAPPKDLAQLSLASQLYRQDHCDEAFKIFQSLLSRENANSCIRTYAYESLLSAYNHCHCWNKLKSLANKLLLDDSFPTRDRVYIALARYYRAVGLTERAKKNFDLSHRYCMVGFTEKVVEQGMALCREHRSAEAKRLLQNAHPESVESAVSIWQCIGYLEEGEGNYSGAISEYSKCIRIADLAPRWWEMRGLAQLKLKQYLKARSDFQKAMSLSFTQQDKRLSALGLAECALGLKQFALASVNYEKAFHSADRESKYGILMREGDLMLLREKFIPAAEYYQQARKVAPPREAQIVCRRIRDAYLLAGRFDKAYIAANELSLLAADDDENLFVRSRILNSLGKYVDANKDLTKLIALFGGSQAGLIYALRADNFYQLGATSKAAGDYRTAIKLDGNQSPLICGLALCLPRPKPGAVNTVAGAKSSWHAEAKLDGLFGSSMLEAVKTQLAKQIDQRWKIIMFDCSDSLNKSGSPRDLHNAK